MGEVENFHIKRMGCSLVPIFWPLRVTNSKNNVLSPLIFLLNTLKGTAEARAAEDLLRLNTL